MSGKIDDAIDYEAVEPLPRTDAADPEIPGSDDSSVIISEGVTCIQDGAFEGRTDLENVTFPSSLERIGARAFSGCTGLKRVMLPKGLKTVGPGAFDGCISLEGFELAEGNEDFIVYKGALYDKWWSLIAYPAGCKTEKFLTPDGTMRISDYAFSGNPFLKSIVLGPNVENVTGKAFLNCKNLTDILVSEGNDCFASSDGALLSSLGSHLVFVPPRPRRLVLELTGINTLGTCCLAECEGVDLLCLHDRLVSVAPDAFGTKCRPMNLSVDFDFDCDVPFELINVDMEPPKDILVSGLMYRRGRNGTYRQKGFMPQSRDPISDMNLPEFDLLGGDYCEEDQKFRPVKGADTRFNDIAGLEEAKELMRNHLILPARYPELFQRFNMEVSIGILLYGPPGTGKTMLARAVATEMGAKFYSVKSSDIRDPLVGRSEENIRELFEIARKDDRAVIFFDDFDSLGRSRGNKNEPWQNDLIDEILMQMQGIEKYSSKLIVLAATNRPWDIDTALMRSGRFSTHIHVGLPVQQARETIFRNRIESIPHAKDIDFEGLALRTEGYNAADVEEVVKTAKMRRISRIDSGEETNVLTMEDLEFALSRVHSSVSKKDLEDIERYRLTGGDPDAYDYNMSIVCKGEVPPGYC